tara:strand:+ start:213 stop:530 length:318 start_codon:yes stop_codon:yes gene_type:complete
MSKIKADHIAINCKDINASVGWYCENLDAKIVYSDSTWAMLSLPGINIALTKESQHPPHIGFEILDGCDFPEGREVKEHRDGSRYVYIEDPDGNVIEYVKYPGAE